MDLRFWKYEGAGNDFILIDGRNGSFNPERSVVKQLCNRHLGVGADGLMILEEDSQAEFRMRYFNADGEESTMCGNGGRCIVLFAHHLGIGGKEKTFMASDGLHTARLLEENNFSGIVRLGMKAVEAIEQKEGYYFLDTGSPHYVEFVSNVRQVNVPEAGAKVRYSREFAPINGTNVNFVGIIAEGHIRVRTYERGVENETLACGTGATAAVLATAVSTESNRNLFIVDVEGGRLEIEFKTNDKKHFSDILLTGPAKRVFEGIVPLESLLIR